MRETLFRGIPKNKLDGYAFTKIWSDNCKGSFVYGSLITSKDRYYICVSALCKINCCINNGMTSMIEVIPETIGQYTGKDFNGEKIYEGDIFETHEDYDDAFGYPTTSYFYSVVIWDEENFCWAFLTDGYIQPFNDWTWDNSQKVGNKHDNPEFLEGGRI